MCINRGTSPGEVPTQVTNHRRPERMQDTRKRAAFYCSKSEYFSKNSNNSESVRLAASLQIWSYSPIYSIEPATASIAACSNFFLFDFDIISLFLPSTHGSRVIKGVAGNRTRWEPLRLKLYFYIFCKICAGVAGF